MNGKEFIVNEWHFVVCECSIKYQVVMSSARIHGQNIAKDTENNGRPIHFSKVSA